MPQQSCPRQGRQPLRGFLYARTRRARHVILLAAALSELLPLAACSPQHAGVEQLLLDSLGTGDGRHEVALGEALGAIPWDELSIVCPYDEPRAVAAELGIDVGRVPDLSATDDQQAIVVASDHSSQSWVFGRSRLDLCSRADWPVMRPGGADRITFEFDHARDSWVAVR